MAHAVHRMFQCYHLGSTWSHCGLRQRSSQRARCFAGVVLVPTAALPLKLVRRSERAAIERALSAPAPLTRLIAVVSRRRRRALQALHASAPWSSVNIRAHDSMSTLFLARHIGAVGGHMTSLVVACTCQHMHGHRLCCSQAEPSCTQRIVMVTCAVQACIHMGEAGSAMCKIGCIAEVKKAKWQTDGTCHALTRGRQRVTFCPASVESGAAPHTLHTISRTAA